MGSKALLLVVTVFVSPLYHPYVAAAHQGQATVKVDLKNTKELAPDLFGIFFEEVSLSNLSPSFVNTPCQISITSPCMQLNNAGEGGLHAELIQDRSFDALAYVSKFAETDDSLVLNPQMLKALDGKVSDAASARLLHNESYGESPRQQTLSQSRWVHQCPALSPIFRSIGCFRNQVMSFTYS